MDYLYRVIMPSVVVGGLMVLIDLYASPWFSNMW
jgi:hypothetical protein